MFWIIATQSTSSTYEGVSWNEKVTLWKAEFYFNGKTRKSDVENRLHADREINQLFENMRPFSRNLELPAISNRSMRGKTSQFKGVYWHKENKRWCVIITVKGHKQKYGGMFKDELDAAKRVNQICEELSIPLQNPGTGAMPNQKWQPKEMTSQYNGVSWDIQNGKWRALLYLHSKKSTHGGLFNDEIDAAKRINQLCEKMVIPNKNVGISATPTQQWKPKQKASQYNGVCWHKQNKKWCVQIHVQGGKIKHGGVFKDELDAAKRANQLCDEMGIPHKNPGINAIPNQPRHAKKRSSQYNGVSWDAGKWRALIYLPGKKRIHGGYFSDELDAAKRVNQVCEEMGIPQKNPEISAMPLKQPKQQTSQYTGLYYRRKTGK